MGEYCLCFDSAHMNVFVFGFSSEFDQKLPSKLKV